jgi:hypothetical protein
MVGCATTTGLTEMMIPEQNPQTQHHTQKPAELVTPIQAKMRRLDERRLKTRIFGPPTLSESQAEPIRPKADAALEAASW